MVKYRAYCDDPLCHWLAPDSWEDEESAWTDIREHVDLEHWPMSGVREER